jgi:Ca2+-dependent lipid-binding protein
MPFNPTTSDPYAVITIGDSSGSTRVVEKSLNPEWNETFYLFVRCV